MRTLRALGTTVEVDLGDGIDETEFDAAWSRCLLESESQEDETLASDERVGPVPSMSGLTQAITRQLIRKRRGELLMLHAGAVSHPITGASVAYVAPGGTGKTTLTRVLAQSHGYLTDETVGVDPVSGEISPYPKPLSTRTPEGGFPKIERGPDELGLQAAHPAPWLAAVVLLRRVPAAHEPRWTRLDLLDGVMAVVPETSSLSALDRPLQVLQDFYGRLGGFWRLEYAEATDLRESITARLEAVA
ncbi:hypothetical protein GA707_14730 [Nostocoides sp. F2B08]|uniref:hypothetical protein n=1 Tax=Nostocoides sp. F2B08 TaxID=2653936 RepID=UPI0012634E7B|nr:hypothetical protein [Tetrasphaera sp. F2B08]KAB7743349.1 hypothetical protein GA707_14730 [Tetrasphaera sp. F2B08]